MLPARSLLRTLPTSRRRKARHKALIRHRQKLDDNGGESVINNWPSAYVSYGCSGQPSICQSPIVFARMPLCGKVEHNDAYGCNVELFHFDESIQCSYDESHVCILPEEWLQVFGVK